MKVSEIRAKMNKLSADHRYYASLLGRMTGHQTVRDMVITDLERNGPSDAASVAKRVISKVKTRVLPFSTVVSELSNLKREGIVDAVKRGAMGTDGRRCKAYMLAGGGK